MSLSAGGSVSNMYAMNLARYKFYPEVKEKGLSGLPRLALFTSEEVKTKQKAFCALFFKGCEIMSLEYLMGHWCNKFVISAILELSEEV